MRGDSQIQANQPTAPNPAIASRSQVGHRWRGVGEPDRFGSMKNYLTITALLLAAFIAYCVLSFTVFFGAGSEWTYLSTLAWFFGAFYINATVSFSRASPRWIVHGAAFVSSAVFCLVLLVITVCLAHTLPPS